MEIKETGRRVDVRVQDTRMHCGRIGSIVWPAIDHERAGTRLVQARLKVACTVPGGGVLHHSDLRTVRGLSPRVTLGI